MFSRTKFSLILCLVILFISACTIQNETTRSGNRKTIKFTKYGKLNKESEYQKIHDYMDSIWDSMKQNIQLIKQKVLYTSMFQSIKYNNN